MAATDRTDVESLIAELEQAEAYEQRLRQLIVDVRDQLAAGRHAAASPSIANSGFAMPHDAAYSSAC